LDCPNWTNPLLIWLKFTRISSWSKEWGVIHFGVVFLFRDGDGLLLGFCVSSLGVKSFFMAIDSFEKFFIWLMMHFSELGALEMLFIRLMMHFFGLGCS